jgi:hypothetical protein
MPKNLSIELILRKCSEQPDQAFYISEILTEQAEIHLNKGFIGDGQKLLEVAEGVLKHFNSDIKEKIPGKILKKIRNLKSEYHN